MGFVKPWPDLERGELTLLFYPGESPPGPKSLPRHRTTGTKDRENHEELCLLGAPLLPSDNPEGKSSSLSSVMKDRTRGRRSILRHSRLNEHSFPRTISTHRVMASTCQRCTPALLARSKPRGGLTPLLWLNTLLDPYSTEERPQVPQSQPGSHTYPYIFSSILACFQKKTRLSCWFYIRPH